MCQMSEPGQSSECALGPGPVLRDCPTAPQVSVTVTVPFYTGVHSERRRTLSKTEAHRHLRWGSRPGRPAPAPKPPLPTPSS